MEERQGWVRGQYESLEVVREEEEGVEWVMVTRSDPGGSVPRWMVERGTPGGIVRDAGRFLGWVESGAGMQVDGVAERGGDVDERNMDERNVDEQKAEGKPERKPVDLDAGRITPPPPPGLLGSAINTITAQMGLLTSGYSQSSTPPESDLESSSISSISTISTLADDAYASCTSLPQQPETDTLSTNSTLETPKHRHAERALQAFMKEKSRLEQKRLRGERKHEKALKKQEKKYQRALEKTSKERVKGGEAKYLQQVRELRGVVEALTKENLCLKERVEELEKGMEKAEGMVREVLKAEEEK